MPGRRRLGPGRRIALAFGGARPDRELEIVRCDAEVLQVRRLANAEHLTPDT